MRFISRKILIASSVAALGLGAYGVNAAPMAVLTASITSIGALNATNVAPMNFGSWLMTGAGGGGEELVFVKSPVTGVVVATPGATSTAVSIVANAIPAQQTVQITGGTADEDGLEIDVTYDNLQNFADTDAVLSAITYNTATETGSNALTISTPATVTIVDGTVAEPVYFGGTVTVAGAIASGANTATIDVTYTY